MMTQKLLIVGGNGFVGSAVCRAALARGWEVTSISSSGKPYHTPRGHLPDWTSKISWHAASALSPSSYRTLLRGRTAVVHTVGTLLETAQYKEAIRDGDVRGLAKTVFGSLVGGDGSNPLKRGATHPASYETLNRDTGKPRVSGVASSNLPFADMATALRVCETYLSVLASSPSEFASELKPYPFVYLSAEDMGRPLIPRRYIETKREAERAIEELCRGTEVRGVFIRPSFIYHPHLRPLTSPIAALAALSATIHEKSPFIVPTPSRILRALSSDPPSPAHLPSALRAMATTLELPPIHLDHVGEAVCKSIESRDTSGPVGLKKMRHLIGWGEPEPPSELAENEKLRPS